MFGIKKRVYLDYASATPVAREAIRVMSDVESIFGNPGSIHAEGVAAASVIDRARESVANELGCKSRQIIFTSGLTESNNLGILGFARRQTLSGISLEQTHWITSSIEHDSVLECFGEIERLGGNVTFVEPNGQGIISPESVQSALRDTTALVSIGWANNEIGTIQPLSRIAHVLRAHEKGIFSKSGQERRIIFHSDAGQAPLYISPQVHTLGIDMLALGSGKLYGPRTIGALYVSDTSLIAPIILGGGQEKGLRAGTEKVVPVAGFAKALDVISEERAKEARRLRDLRNHMAREIIARIPGAVINGDMNHMLPHMLNVSIPGNRSGEYLVLQLDHAGIALSTKSACRAGEARSHVVSALGGEPWRAENTLRISLGRDTTARELARATSMLAKAVQHSM